MPKVEEKGEDTVLTFSEEEVSVDNEEMLVIELNKEAAEKMFADLKKRMAKL